MAQDRNILSEIELRGYKSIENLRLRLFGLNVLIGANGAGKSNLISFFRLLNAMCIGRLQAFVAEAGGADALLRYTSKHTAAIEARLRFSGTTGDNEYIMKLAHGAPDRLLFLDESVRYSRQGMPADTAPLYVLGAGHAESLLLSAKVDANGKKLPENTPRIIRHLMNDWRVFQFHDTSSTARVKLACRVDDVHFLRADAGNLAAMLLDIRSNAPRAYLNIVETVRRVLPAFDDFALQPHPTAHTVMLTWTHKTSTELFYPHQLSDGSLRFIALATLLLQPRLPSLILIDEPELGLHPFAIELLAGLLRSASHKSQLLISTQSVTLANQLSAEDVIVVESGDGASTFSRLDKDRYATWLESYRLGDLWAKNVLGGTP